MLIRRLTLEPCLPRPAKEPPPGPGWIYEIKHDGFRILARREGGRMRLFTHGVIPGWSHTPAPGISSRVNRLASRALLSWRAAMEHYVGLDVSLKLTAICIVDRTGRSNAKDCFFRS